ncbi:MAG: GTPase Era [Gammaproteobacteria bacterium]|nr:GTPase Era [Gammaproteobacteria bacterium]MBI5614753.1 GTPase Era [Gammaproteobacteria bacterium]
MNATRCGTVAIVGRPNVGKSTLLNRIVGQKISITSRKPQTTRHRLLGIHTAGPNQFLFIDTPGWQRQPKGHLNRFMNRQIDIALSDIDAVVMVCDARRWMDEDEEVAAALPHGELPCLLALNKHDRVHPKERLLALMAELDQRHHFRHMIPTCALSGDNVDLLLETIAQYLPEARHRYGEDEVTDRPVRFLAAEMIREKLTRQLGDELPYAVHVTLDKFEEQDAITHIEATIWVEREGQKAIVIGNKGERLKLVSSEARIDLERLLDRKVYLRCWVRLQENWSEDPRHFPLAEPGE